MIGSFELFGYLGDAGVCPISAELFCMGRTEKMNIEHRMLNRKKELGRPRDG